MEPLHERYRPSFADDPDDPLQRRLNQLYDYADDVETRDTASALLLGQADRIVPLLVDLSRRVGPSERRNRLSDLLERYFASRPGEKPGPRLPYGCTISRIVSTGCGPCGRGHVNEDQRRILAFLKE